MQKVQNRPFLKTSSVTITLWHCVRCGVSGTGKISSFFTNLAENVVFYSRGRSLTTMTAPFVICSDIFALWAAFWYLGMFIYVFLFLWFEPKD
ncbi:hypothetical protein CDAR_101261 [Caerostris darwini]|uniref:Uncharacterized protein n=1 Tax=Caerostris darwini TaxID=1538125 RepID=A0AAV4QED0_9ARAC|nr:hypothetical protein CDAR_101261 [Caerostris darwini]